MAFALNLNVDRNGVVTGTGYEPLTESVRRSFTLRDGRIHGVTIFGFGTLGKTIEVSGMQTNRFFYERAQ